jgi:hypothetical protein
MGQLESLMKLCNKKEKKKKKKKKKKKFLMNLGRSS